LAAAAFVVEPIPPPLAVSFSDATCDHGVAGTRLRGLRFGVGDAARETLWKPFPPLTEGCLGALRGADEAAMRKSFFIDAGLGWAGLGAQDTVLSVRVTSGLHPRRVVGSASAEVPKY